MERRKTLGKEIYTFQASRNLSYSRSKIRRLDKKRRIFLFLPLRYFYPYSSCSSVSSCFTENEATLLLQASTDFLPAFAEYTIAANTKQTKELHEPMGKNKTIYGWKCIFHRSRNEFQASTILLCSFSSSFRSPYFLFDPLTSSWLALKLGRALILWLVFAKREARALLLCTLGNNRVWLLLVISVDDYGDT